MLIVHWNEDKEGCLLASWYDDERIEHGDFVETVVHMEDYIDFRRPAMHALDADEDYELEAPERPPFALAGCR